MQGRCPRHGTAGGRRIPGTLRLAPCGAGRGWDGADVRRMVPAVGLGLVDETGWGAWKVPFYGEAEGSPSLLREAEPELGALAAVVALFWVAPGYRDVLALDRACGSSRSLGGTELPAWKADVLCVVSRPPGTRASGGHHDREVS